MKILLCDPVDDVVLDHFENHENFIVEEVFDRNSLLQEISDANFLVVRSGTTVDSELLDKGEDLIGIVRAGVGLDNIDLDYADEVGVTVHNTPEASSNAVAELVVGHILSLFRSIPRADEALKNGNWIKSDLNGREIQGKTVGVIGYGRIGRRTGELIESFGADVIAYDEYLDDEEIREHGGTPVPLDNIYENADLITVHVPLTDETHHLIGEDEIARMGDDTVLINCARGGIYDEEALNDALREGRLLGVGLDTYETEPPGDSPLIDSDSMVGTPHIGGATAEAQGRIGQLVIDKIERMVSQ